VMMPPDDYGFSKRFTWVEDRFGVSWQLSVPSSRSRIEPGSPLVTPKSGQ
jgi:predicted 3-demethylubiquinone-9 3-methyltransferase (glyoxalase superfamily)